MNFVAILKMLGIKLAPETAAQIQAMIPQIPGKVNELIKANAAAIKNFDERLSRIEAALERLEHGPRHDGGNSNYKRIGAGTGSAGDGAGTN